MQILDEQDYDPGLLNDYGGGNVDWWFDYLRHEVNRCNEYWRSLIESYDEPKTQPDHGECDFFCEDPCCRGECREY